MTTELKQTPFVSIIIPVYNDSDFLKVCLPALSKQTYAKDRYEIIVVDNNSEEDISKVTNQFEQVTLAHESTPGSYIARNKGLSIAKGDIIAFTDADCIPQPNWLEKGVSTLTQRPNIGLVAGRIELFYRDPKQPKSFELYDSLTMGFPQEDFVKDSHFGATANLFTFRSVIDKVGGFDENLKSAGDRQWGKRVYDNGYEQVYDDDVCIRHPARYSWADVKKRAIRITGGRYDLAKRSWTSRWDAVKDLVDYLRPPFRSFFRIWADKRLHSPQQKLQFTIVMLRIRDVVIKERLRLQLGGGTPERS
ncbi:glycosyltransferase [Leptothoe spongobia]|uniref:Glycosyltransferase family 2 protein n=1 Tax=Leptothoe spongobia TAU-MAC 1115 TaxID=1967444 RepID=A0A947GL11_9CYAN|nr:glycosyltransferase family 2 protein [Leptothoe spongobia]MBT9314741.1 glycosyltransferase family 2 protein [Leptothoe spongobia TAU-MAC 1115]